MTPLSATPVVHLELHTGNLARACAFYAQLCGWRPERIDAGGRPYLALETGGEVGGGIVECETRRPLWLPYVEVPEISATTERARELGASVLLEPREGPAGWRSVVTSPAGGEVALWQPKPGNSPRANDEFPKLVRSQVQNGSEPGGRNHDGP